MIARTISIALFTALLLAGCGRKETPKNTEQAAAPSTNVRGAVAEAFGVVNRSPKAPNFSWIDTTGTTQTFDAHRGKVAFVNFWATWCGPCRKETPDLVALAQEFSGKGVLFIGVAEDRGPNVPDVVKSFTAEQKIPYQIVLGSDELDEAFGNPRALPTTYLVDASGTIVQTIVGMRTKEFYAQAINALLNK